MGTPDFAVTILDGLLKHDVNIVGVVTSPDRPSGRGQKINQSAVKKYSDANELTTLQPVNLKDEGFQSELRALKADIQIIVAFRMLPESVWNMPPKGSVNLHASLLPHYRGAAPINWAILNGEKKSGVTTFFLQHQIDTGDVIFQQETAISETMTAGELHDELMHIGSELINKTYDAIESGTVPSTPQTEMNVGELKSAPKIFKPDCEINWNESINVIFNLVRGMNPFPTAWTNLIDESGASLTLKIFGADKVLETHKHDKGSIKTDGKSYLYIYGPDGYLSIKVLQLQGKRRMDLEDYLRGSKINDEWKVT
jgi:methionyl-tRNA formyltransferase